MKRNEVVPYCLVDKLLFTSGCDGAQGERLQISEGLRLF